MKQRVKLAQALVHEPPHDLQADQPVTAENQHAHGLLFHRFVFRVQRSRLTRGEIGAAVAEEAPA